MINPKLSTREIKNNLYFYNFQTIIGDIYYIWINFNNDLKNIKLNKKNNKEELNNSLISETNKNDFVSFIGVGENAFYNFLDKLALNYYSFEPIIIRKKNINIENEILNYLNKKSKTINLAPYFLFGTHFEIQVWYELTKIPFGKTACYKDIAVLINKPKAYRAVGTAIGKNPLLLLVPCHRIIKSNGHIGNFSSGIKLKEFLLRLESN